MSEAPRRLTCPTFSPPPMAWRWPKAFMRISDSKLRRRIVEDLVEQIAVSDKL